MARPRKDPGAPVKPKAWEGVKLPVGPGRYVLVKYPVGGLTFTECQLLKSFLPVLLQVDADQEEFDELRED